MTKPRPHLIVPGAQKAATTWVQHILDWNPGFWVPPRAQELHVLNAPGPPDLHAYEALFEPARPDQVTGDVSPAYLYDHSVPEHVVQACEVLGRPPRLLILLREPVSRLRSAYEMRLRKGDDVPLDRALKEDPRLYDWGLYAKHIEPYLEVLDRDSLWFVLVEEIHDEPDTFLTELAAFVEVEAPLVDPYEGVRVNPGGDRRSRLLATAMGSAGKPLRALGLNRILHRFKRSRPVQALYELNTRSDPLDEATERRLEGMRGSYEESVRRLGELIDRPDLAERWGYTEVGR